ncbi:hypothetical protein ACJO2E_02620 [Marinobacter sp. M1N3S26]|uniref:hypothetical protein n=1 Tax=Marinobacter sp. M1N3S26 TaxID=3382299 RepID=UPI00387B6C55
MKNKLTDLNNHLFAQLERLNDEELAGEELKEEIMRSRAITGVSKEIVSNARLVLDAEQYKRENGLEEGPAMLEQGNGDA